MRAVVQRVFSAHVEVDGERVGATQNGLVAFVGAGKDDRERDADYLADKVAGLRVFEDDRGKMSLSVDQVGGSVLAVSQFTLFGDMRRGRRPSFDAAMQPEQAKSLFERFVARLQSKGLAVQTGRFGAMMRVFVDNNGPVTILIDSKKTF